MPQARTLLASVAIVLALAGCSSAPAGPSVPTATAPPVPTTMSVEESADFYLDTVCPPNAASAEVNIALQNFNTADVKDVAPVNVAAGTARDASEAAAKRFDDPEVLWPDNVKDDILLLRDQYFADIGTLDAYATTTSEGFYSIAFSDPAPSAGAAQRIRSRLDIGADTTSTCAGR